MPPPGKHHPQGSQHAADDEDVSAGRVVGVGIGCRGGHAWRPAGPSNSTQHAGSKTHHVGFSEAAAAAHEVGQHVEDAAHLALHLLHRQLQLRSNHLNGPRYIHHNDCRCAPEVQPGVGGSDPDIYVPPPLEHRDIGGKCERQSHCLLPRQCGEVGV
jgi:hypothetical protein